MIGHLRCLWVLSILTSSSPAEDWLQWRGPSAQGAASIAKLPLTWSETSHVTWKTELPGRGHSTPLVVGDTIWITTAMEKAASEAEAKERLKTNTGDQPLSVLSAVTLRAIAIDLKSGKLLHNIELITVKDPQWAHELNSYATPTPVIHDGRLYASFGSFGAVCLELSSQKALWKNTELQVMHENGPGSTPVLWQDKLIVHFDGSDSQFIAAYDTATGKLAWKTPRTGEMDPRPQQKKAYGTPLVIQSKGRPLLVSPAANNLYGYDPSTGRELWKLPFGELGFSMSTLPVADDERIYFSTGFGKSKILAVKHAGDALPELAWTHGKNAPKMSSPALHDGLLYFVDDGGILTCLDAATGTQAYKERLGGKFSSSPIIVGNKLLIGSREGSMVVVPTGRSFSITATNTLDAGIMASPSTDGQALILRTEKALYRIEQ
jgi:outer membrane protein assembly factor BamB